MSTLLDILTKVQNGECNINDALAIIQSEPAETIEDACLDHHRSLRTGIPEVVYAASKTTEQLITIGKTMLERNDLVLMTRVSREKADIICESLPRLHYHEKGSILSANPRKIDEKHHRGNIVVVCAGTSDIPIAEEALVTIECLGHPVEKLYDVGVAGLHRILSQQSLLSSATVIIVVAGMEGALPSVVGGLVSAPVIGVPTSIGYGANFGGVSALLGMLNSCAPGLAVVNIDNGFGAACMAVAINSQ